MQGKNFHALLIRPKSSAIISILLALPFAYLFLHFILEIELRFEPLDPILEAQNNHLGSWIVLGALVFLVIGLIVSVIPIARNFQEGGNLMANPINFAIAIALLVLIVSFFGLIVVNQYPCWIGVANCD